MLDFNFFKKGSENSFSNWFCVWCFKKNVSHVVLYQLIEISLSDCVYFLRYWAMCVLCTVILCFPGYNVINFEINLIFPIKPFFCMTKTWLVKKSIFFNFCWILGNSQTWWAIVRKTMFKRLITGGLKFN